MRRLEVSTGRGGQTDRNLQCFREQEESWVSPNGTILLPLKSSCQKSTYRRCGERCLFFLCAAPTFCQIAGLEVPDWMQGRALPQHQIEANTQDRQRVLTEWDSDFDGDTLRLRTIYRDGYTSTVYERSSLYEGSEGELYDHSRDPLQRENLWSDPAYESIRSDLVADLYDNLPPEPDERAEVMAPV